MKALLKTILIGLTAIIITACGNTTKVANNNSEVLGASTMKAAFNFEATMEQVDSVRIADNLPKLDEWFAYSFIDYETGIVFYRYTFSVQGDKCVYKYTLLLDDESPYPFKKIMSK